MAARFVVFDGYIFRIRCGEWLWGGGSKNKGCTTWKFSAKSFSYPFARKLAFSPNHSGPQYSSMRMGLEAPSYNDMMDPRDITIQDLIEAEEVGWLHHGCDEFMREYFAQVHRHLPFWIWSLDYEKNCAMHAYEAVSSDHYTVCNTLDQTYLVNCDFNLVYRIELARPRLSFLTRHLARYTRLLPCNENLGGFLHMSLFTHKTRNGRPFFMSHR